MEGLNSFNDKIVLLDLISSIKIYLFGKNNIYLDSRESLYSACIYDHTSDPPERVFLFYHQASPLPIFWIALLFAIFKEYYKTVRINGDFILHNRNILGMK